MVFQGSVQDAAIRNIDNKTGEDALAAWRADYGEDKLAKDQIFKLANPEIVPRVGNDLRAVKGDVEAATNEIGFFFKRLHEVLEHKDARAAAEPTNKDANAAPKTDEQPNA